MRLGVTTKMLYYMRGNRYIDSLTLMIKKALARASFLLVGHVVQIQKEMRHIFINVPRYSRMDQVKFFKSCLPQILLRPILNT